MCVPLGHRNNGGRKCVADRKRGTVLGTDGFIRSRYWDICVGFWGKVDPASEEATLGKYWAELDGEERIYTRLLKDLRKQVEEAYLNG